MSHIQVFDEIQRKDAKEQAKSMGGSTETLNDYIEFGRVWHRDGYGMAISKYEAAKTLRELEEPESFEEFGESA